MGRKLVKRWRLDAVVDHAAGLEAGIYVDRDSGVFYAYVPESDDGQLYESKDKRELVRQVRTALKEWADLNWVPVISVKYEAAYRYKTHRTGMSGTSHRWNPDDIETASDKVGPLHLDRMYRCADGPDFQGEPIVRYREWDNPARTWNVRKEWDTMRGERYLPYDEATWVALHDFRHRIKELDHAIRTLLGSDDLTPRLIAACREPLLLLEDRDDS